MSPSRTPTCSPSDESAYARLAVSVDFPTPPLPDATAMTRVAGESEIVRSALVPASQARHERGLLLGRHDVEAEPHARDARNLADEARDLLLERVAQRAAGDGERDRHRDRAVVLDEDVAHHVELGHRALELGVDDVLERLQDRVAVGLHPGERSCSRSGSAVCERARRARASQPRRGASACRDRAAPKRTADPRTARSRARTRGRAAARRRCRRTARPSGSTTPSTRPAARWHSDSASEPITRTRPARSSDRADASAMTGVVVPSKDRISIVSFGRTAPSRTPSRNAPSPRSAVHSSPDPKS